MELGRKKIALFLLVIVLCVGMLCSSLAYGVQLPEENSWDNLQQGEMHLIKKAERIPGKVNSWKITVTAEGRDQVMPVDFLIVFDKSASMKDYAKDDAGNEMSISRLKAAQNATNELIDDIFDDNEGNRVGFISYSSAIYNAGTLGYNAGTTHVTVHNQLTEADDATQLHTTVNGITGTGGTNTQLALHEAGEMMTQAHQADPNNERRRVIILLTDGVPTMGVPVDWEKVKNENPEVFVPGNANEVQSKVRYVSSSGTPMYVDNQTGYMTSRPTTNGIANEPYYRLQTDKYPTNPISVITNTDGIPQDAFDYNNASQYPLGWGSARWVKTEETVSIDGQDEVIYADLLQNTVAEANFIRDKADANGNPDVDAIHVIAYDADSNLEAILRHITNNNDDYYHPASGESVGDAMQKILNIEGSTSSTAALVDEIPVGFNEATDINVTSGTYEYKDNVISWDIGVPTLIREGTEPTVRYAELSYVLTADDTEAMAGAGPYNTNGTTQIDYTTPGKQSGTSNVESPQVDTLAYEVTKTVIDAPDGENETYTVKITGPGNYSQQFTIQENETKKYVNFTDVGTYKVEEIVNQDKYAVKYLINGQEKDTFDIDWGSEDVLNAGSHVAITIQNTRTYNVTHEFTSGTEGKELPEEVTNLLPNDQTGKTNGTQVTPTQPAQTEVVVEGGKWVFEGYDRDGDTIEGADENFTGTWVFVEDTYKVTHEFTSGTEGKDLPEEVTNLLPNDQTGKTNGTEVTPTQPTQTEVVVDGGKWVFEGYDRDGDTIEGADENFTGTWVFVEDTYKVTHEFTSGTEGKELPEEVTNLLPNDQTGKTNGTEVTPTQPTQTEVVVDGGKWVFEGYDRDGDTIEGADENFTGTWVFVEDTYDVTHEFVSGTEGKELPEEVTNLLPEDQTGKTNGTEVTPTQPTQTEVVVDGGKWVFEGYDRDGDTIEGADENFTGTWVFVEDTYNVTHEFTSGTEGKELPEEVTNLLPEDQTGKTNGTQVTPTQPTQTEVVVDGGKWVFEGYDRDGDTIEGADENFTGTWVFVEDTYNVTHEFTSGTEGKDLPEEVIALIPNDQTGKTNGTEVTPTQPTQTEVVVEGGKWVFEGYDRDGDIIEGADENFTGTWVFVEDTYDVTHEFVSGTEGKELPEEVTNLLPEDQTGKTNGTEVTPTQPTQTEVVVDGGKWVFEGYDRDGDTIEGADENFTGTWVFVEDTYKVTHEFTSGTEGKDLPEEVTNLLPNDQTGKTNGTQVTPTQPTQTEVVVEGGKWVFEGYDRDGDTIEGADENFTGTWVFVEDTYKVTHEFTSGTEGKELPEEVTNLLPEDQTGKTNGTQVTPTQPTQTEVVVDGGKWVFEGYDRDGDTIEGADENFTGTWVFVEDTYNVTHEFTSGTEGKDLPEEVIALIPNDQTGKTNGTEVTPTQPTQTEVVVDGGKWVFEGYDRDGDTIEGADENFTGTWVFVEDTYKVTHEFTSGTEGKELPEEVTNLLPNDQTGKTNGTEVTPTQPTQTEVVVDGGKWVFEGYDRDGDTIEGADENFTGTWVFVEDTYDVTHEFVSGTEGKELPEEVIALIPNDQTGKTNGTEVTPTQPTQTEVVVDGGKWVFEGYDRDGDTIEGADENFTGTWVFVEDTYKVTHEFTSGTEGKDLPEEVTNLLPEDQTGKTNGTQVTPTQPTQTEVVVDGGKWVFEGYDRDGDTIEGADENFTGTWVFVEDTYNVTHEFTSGTEGKDLPEEVIALIPNDQTGKTNGTEVTPTQPTQTEVVVEGGKWVFEGYDRDGDIIEGADENFTGTWVFVEDTYDVTHEFVSGTEGKDLPEEVTNLLPEDQTGKTNGTEVTPTQPTQTEVVVEGGKWVFEGYDRDGDTIEGADENFTGTWVFVEDTYDVTHEFVSGTEGKELPEEVIALIPNDQTGKTNGTEVAPTQPTQTEVVVEGGKWVFEGYDRDGDTIEGADENFTGTWVFVEDAPSEEPNPEYPGPQDPKPEKPVDEKPEDITPPEKDTTEPNTGDNTDMSVWAILMLISGGCLIGVNTARKKQKNS